jgi:hypothetical protein
MPNRQVLEKENRLYWDADHLEGDKLMSPEAQFQVFEEVGGYL